MAERIGIFQGRSGQYNKAILEVLAEALIDGEMLKEWELAKRIQKMIGSENNWYAEAQRIYSVLIRKNGRLNDLREKWYVDFETKTEEETGRKVRYWHPTVKGLVAALLLRPDLIDKVPKSPVWESKELQLGLKKRIRKLSKFTKKKHYPIRASYKPLIKLGLQFMDYFRDEERLRRLISDVELLISKGFQLDMMGEMDFYLMLQLTPSIKEMQRKLGIPS